jgi:two-component system chemotaxis response regulator CheB
VLFRIREGKLDRFRCHTGHGYGTQALAEALAQTSEAALWEAVKTLQESTALLDETAGRVAQTGDAEAAAAISARASAIADRLGALRQLALSRDVKLDDELTGTG